MLQCFKGKRPNLILVDKKGKSCAVVDIAVPGDCRVREKELEKNEKYQSLKIELKRLLSLKSRDCTSGCRSSGVH